MGRILVVDDEKSIRELLSKIIENMGHEVILLDEVDDAPQLENVVDENCETCADGQEFKVIYSRPTILRR